jgi:hypothetical protein
MQVDRGSFLMLVATLAAGGAIGYLASERRLTGREEAAPAAKASPTAAAADAAPAATPAPTPAAPPAPVCDDSTGSVGECPGPGAPSVEGGCGNFAQMRCKEFKETMKPRVAQAAVECLNKLNGAERCDKERVNLCGHLALMNACPDVEAAADAGESPARASCKGIVQVCGPSPVAPAIAECRQVYNAMNDTGRDRMMQCLKKHCFDKGVLGCEAVTPK